MSSTSSILQSAFERAVQHAQILEKHGEAFEKMARSFEGQALMREKAEFIRSAGQLIQQHARLIKVTAELALEKGMSTELCQGLKLSLESDRQTQ